MAMIPTMGLQRLNFQPAGVAIAAVLINTSR